LNVVRNNIKKIEEMGKIMNRYYVDTDTVIKVVNEDQDPKKLLE